MTQTGEVNFPLAVQQLKDSLTLPQLQIIEKLMEGRTIAAAAREMNVSRSAVYSWMNDNEAFRAVYLAWKDRLLATSRARLSDLTHSAICTLEGAVREGDVRSAITVLRSQGLLDAPKVG